MSLSDSLTLKDHAAADVVFNTTTVTTDPKTGQTTKVREAVGFDPSAPLVLTIKTQKTGKGAGLTRRVNVNASRTKLDTALNPSVAQFYGQIVMPLNGQFSDNDIDDLICYVADLILSTASLAVDSTKRAALLRGES